MYRNRKGRQSFKPPLLKSTPSDLSQQSTPETGGSQKPISQTPKPEDDMECLKAKEAELDTEIKKLEEKGCKPGQYKEYINLLHSYNEVKDVAQMFMGRLAVYECVTNKEIARRYNAPELNE